MGFQIPIALGAEREELPAELVRQAGADSAGLVSRVAAELDRPEHWPRLEAWSPIGERTEEIVFHSAHHEVGRCVWTHPRRAELRVSCSLDPALPPLWGHANALGQVVLNLLTNAVQAIGGTGTIRVKTEFVGGKVHLEVADDGPGILPEALPKIFEPFYTTRSSGSGLGLSVSYGIVQDHNGTIDVRSEPGHGATFRLSFPPAPEPRCNPESAGS